MSYTCISIIRGTRVFQNKITDRLLVVARTRSITYCADNITVVPVNHNKKYQY